MAGSVAVVQLVTAAIAIAPWVNSYSVPMKFTATRLSISRLRSAQIALKRERASLRAKRSCGRLGPASEHSTSLKFSSSTSEYTRDAPSFHMPCAFAYASTSATCSLSRPVSSRYSSVRSSTGNSVHVQPYSGVMFAMQARCVAESVATPSPKHSTNLPTTPFARNICANVSAASIADTPSRSSPVK